MPGVADSVKVELYDGAYDCLICSESVRPALRGDGGGGGGVLKCRACTSAPLHARCVAVAGVADSDGYATQCPTCGRDTVGPWLGPSSAPATAAGLVEVVTLCET